MVKRQRIDCGQRSRPRKLDRMVEVHGLWSHNHGMARLVVLDRRYHFDIGQSHCSLVFENQCLYRSPVARHLACGQESVREGTALVEEENEALSQSYSPDLDEQVVTIFEKYCWSEVQRLVVMVSCGGMRFLVGPIDTLHDVVVFVNEDVSLCQSLCHQNRGAELGIVGGHSGCGLVKAVCLCEATDDDQRRSLVQHVVRYFVVVHHMGSASGDEEVSVVVCLDVERTCVVAFLFEQGMFHLYRDLQDSLTFV